MPCASPTTAWRAVAGGRSLLLQVFERYGGATTQSPGFKAWFAANAEWLRPYAAFCLLRDMFQARLLLFLRG